MCSFHGLQTSSPITYLAKEMLFLTPCPQYFVFSLNQSQCPYLCCTSSCLTSVPKSTWVLFLGINVLSYWFHVFFRACPVPSHRTIHMDSFPELELWTLILFLLNLTLVLSPFSPFPCTLQLYPASESKQESMENTLSRGLCPCGGGLRSISKLGRLSFTSFAFGYPPKMPGQVSECLSTQGRHPGRSLSTKCWPASQIPAQIHPFCGQGRIWVLFPPPWLLCQTGSWQ